MKKGLIAIVITTALFSCKKETINRESLTPPPVESNAYADDVWRNITVNHTRWTDTSSYVLNSPYLNLFIGDSFIANWMWNFAWADSMAKAPYYGLNRAIGGSTFASYMRFVDSCAKYKHKVKNVCIRLGVTNECFIANGAPVNLKPAFYAFMKKVLDTFKTAGINYDLATISPKLKVLGYESYIISFNQMATDYFDSLKRNSSNPGRFRIVPVSSDMEAAPVWTTMYASDSLHPTGNAHRTVFVKRWREAINLNTGRVDSSVAPVPEPNPYPNPVGPLTARAGADQNIPLSWNYCRLNGNTSTIGNGGWISSLQWTQVSGPSTVTYQNQNAGNTLIYGMVAGVYKFRLKVTGTAKVNNVYTTFTAYDEIQVTFN